MWLLPLLYIEARLETSDGKNREKAPVERFQRRRDSGASSLVLGTKKRLVNRQSFYLLKTKSILVQLGHYRPLQAEQAVVGAGNPGHHATEAVLAGPVSLCHNGIHIVEGI